MKRRDFLGYSAMGATSLMCGLPMASANGALDQIGEGSWSDSASALKTLCISQASMSIEWHLRRFYSIERFKFHRIGSYEVDGRHFDVYEASLGGDKREYWMDVSYWYGRGLDLLPSRDIPMPGSTRPVNELFSGPSSNYLPFNDEYKKEIDDYLSSWNVYFGMFSSEQLSQTIATTVIFEGEFQIRATAVRRYLADELPLFHGFRFVAPFIAHQLYHLVAEGRISALEMKPKADYYVPVPGKDCIDFDRLPSNNPANDFWNYMLSNHMPDAFADDGEKQALIFAIKSATSTGLLSMDELQESLLAMRVNQEDKVALVHLFD